MLSRSGFCGGACDATSGSRIAHRSPQLSRCYRRRASTNQGGDGKPSTAISTPLNAAPHISRSKTGTSILAGRCTAAYSCPLTDSLGALGALQIGEPTQRTPTLESKTNSCAPARGREFPPSACRFTRSADVGMAHRHSRSRREDLRACLAYAGPHRRQELTTRDRARMALPRQSQAAPLRAWSS